MSIETMALRYWELGNYVVGFAAVQTLAVMYVLAQKPDTLNQAFTEWGPFIGLMVGVAVCLGIYLWVIWWVHEIEEALLSDSSLGARDRSVLKDASKSAYKLRWGLVEIIQGLVLIVFLGIFGDNHGWFTWKDASSVSDGATPVATESAAGGEGYV